VDTITNISSYYGVKSEKLNRHYKKNVSGFDSWNQKIHATNYLIFPENIGPYLSIDEVSMSNGELYTFLTNKDGKGKEGTLVAVIMGTKSDDIKAVLDKICLEKRKLVQEVTLDMAKNMEVGVKSMFPNAILVTDRFHVAKLALDALQHIRVKLRWEEMDKENDLLSSIKKIKKEFDIAFKASKNQPENQAKLVEDCKKEMLKFKTIEFENGDSPKQLLARSRYILAKKENQWTHNQKERAAILFSNYPQLKTAYHEVLAFRNIYEDVNMESAKLKFEAWIQKVQDNEMKAFYTVANTVNNNLSNIVNFFKNRHTNANAESFNSKIKLFRANLRGVTDTTFFLFRLYKLFA
jgi:transposase